MVIVLVSLVGLNLFVLVIVNNFNISKQVIFFDLALFVCVCLCLCLYYSDFVLMGCSS